MNSLRRAQVSKYYPGANVADLVFLDDGYRCAKVPLLCDASTNTGTQQVADPSAPTDEFFVSRPADRTLIAIVGYVGMSPVILGFLKPTSGETFFDEPDRFVKRVGSDVYVTVDGSGNMEVAHPNGTFIRIGESADHEDLTGKDFNKRWNIRRNKGKATHLKIGVSNGGVEQASLHITPDGQVTIEANGDASINTQGNAVVNAAGNALVVANSVVCNADISAFTGDVIVTRNLFLGGDMQSGGQVSDALGTMSQLRTAALGHNHTVVGGTTVAIQPSSPPPSLPPRSPSQVEMDNAAEDAYVPPNQPVPPEDFDPITLAQYFNDKPALYPGEYTPAIIAAATALLAKVNALLLEAGIERTVNSGWRPLAYNVSIGGALHSLHITAHAIDCKDSDFRLKTWILSHPDALVRHGLYMEAASATRTWCHLQDVAPASGRRVFYP